MRHLRDYRSPRFSSFFRARGNSVLLFGQWLRKEHIHLDCSKERRPFASALPMSAALQPLWRGYAAGVGGIIIVAVWTSDLRGSAVITWRVISTRGSSTYRGSTDRSSTDAHRHSRAYTTVDATTVNAATVNPTALDPTAIICGGVSRNSTNKSDADNDGCSERNDDST